MAAAIRYLGGEPSTGPRPQIQAPATRQEAQQKSREIEGHVIDVYQGLIEDCPEPSVRELLQHIQSANRRHLQTAGG